MSTDLFIKMDMKRLFFDQPAVTRAVSKAQRQRLSKAGAFVRRTARGKLKPAAQKTLGELTDDERQTFRIRQAEAKKKGKPTPKRPRRPSRAGEPPRLAYAQSPLKQLLFFAFDPGSRSVVVGPQLFKSNSPTVPEALEFGNRSRGLNERPFMGPSLDENRNEFSDLWAGSVRG